MNISIGPTLSELRKAKRLKQKDVAALLSGYGPRVNAKTIYNWEKGLAQPSIPHFLALCDLLDVDDVLWRFAGLQKGPYAGLNRDGRLKARELIDLLSHIDMYKAADGDFGIEEGFDITAKGGFSNPAGDGSEQPLCNEGEEPRLLRLYDIPVSAGTGNFLDDSGYEMIEAPTYVPVAVDFALRVSGDSMEPQILDGQVIWVKEQELLDSGDIGIFTYSDNVYCKKLIADGSRAYLRSLNPIYEDIEIKEDFGFKTIGKVV